MSHVVAKMTLFNKVLLEKSTVILYNKINLKCSIYLDILNLHHFKRESYIFRRTSGLILSVEGRNLFAVTHLAYC